MKNKVPLRSFLNLSAILEFALSDEGVFMRAIDQDLHSLSAEEHARLARLVMHKQAALSLRVALVFVILVFGLPLVNNFLPELAGMRIMGFTATWLFLGVLFFPITWALSAYFIKESNRLEEECSDWRSVLGLQAAGAGEVKPAFADEDGSEGNG